MKIDNGWVLLTSEGKEWVIKLSQVIAACYVANGKGFNVTVVVGGAQITTSTDSAGVNELLSALGKLA